MWFAAVPRFFSVRRCGLLQTGARVPLGECHGSSSRAAVWPDGHSREVDAVLSLSRAARRSFVRELFPGSSS